MVQPPSATDANGCFHCGEPLPAGAQWRVPIDGMDRPMCCVGCMSIARAIVDAGAEGYYRQRKTPGLDGQSLEALAPWISLLDDPQWSAQHVRVSEAQKDLADGEALNAAVAETTLAIEGLRCGACAWLIERILTQTPGVLAARANASTARLHLRWSPDRVALTDIARRVAAIGYALLPLGSATLEKARRTEDRRALRRLFVAGLSAAQIMMYAYPEYMEGAGLDDDVRHLMRTASMLITVPVIVYSATPFFTSAWRMLRQGRVGMDVPVSLGLIIAFAASMWAWWTRQGEVYFDSVSMFVFLLLGARWIEARIRTRTSAHRERLATAPPVLAHRLQPDTGHTAAWNLRPGDLIRVGSGERIPADGRLISDATEVDTALLTGESLPVAAQRGDRLSEGSINLGPAIDMTVELSAAEGTLSRLSQLAEQAAADRPRWVAWADRIGAQFTVGILLLSTALALGSIALGQPASVWIPAVIAVLVVTCPCALSMAGPAAYAAALARLLELGSAASTSSTLEAAASVTDVIFDKTGTLTDPSRAEVRMVFGSHDDWIPALAIAQESRHPLAVAVARTAVQRLQEKGEHPSESPVAQAQNHAGLGISGSWRDHALALGSAHFVDPDGQHRELLVRAPECTVFLSVDGELRCGFALDDQARPEAADIIAKLQAAGLTVWCLSGDRPDRVARLCTSLGIESDHFKASCTPADKQTFVRTLQERGARVLMVGDGHNDAPVLAQADVSMAVNSAAPLARQKADIYLVNTGLGGVCATIALSRQARRVLRQNLTWAISYNLIAIPFAAAGWISPLIASIGMAGSSLIVVLNAARLLRFG
jgi:Cu2+-exporting ATPase